MRAAMCGAHVPSTAQGEAGIAAAGKGQANEGTDHRKRFQGRTEQEEGHGVRVCRQCGGESEIIQNKLKRTDEILISREMLELGCCRASWEPLQYYTC